MSLTCANRLRSALGLQQPNASAWAQSCGYDAARRLTSLASPSGAFNSSYSGGAHWCSGGCCPTIAYVTNVFEPLARLSATYFKHAGHTKQNADAGWMCDVRMTDTTPEPIS